ncbi:MAG: uncharacterized protein JWO36_4013 [Myxococcales bacterium]|nr:uncharacterized protein [Myxococcales bacterium]
MYRYGDGTPFPLDENFIDTLTSAVETCTAAFMPLTELDARRERAKAGRLESEKELGRLTEFEKNLTNTLTPYMAADRKAQQTQAIAQKTLAAAKQAIQMARTQTEGRLNSLEAQASARTASDAVLHALRPFFDAHQLPNAKWIMSWDVRGADPHADAIATSGRLSASFTLAVDAFRQPIRVDTLAEAVIVHMMKKGLLGKAKPAPVELGKYVMVAYERTANEHVVTLRENPNKVSQGLRFAVNEAGATWQSINPQGDAETEANPLDIEDVDGVRRLAEAANKALKDLMSHRALVDLTLAGKPLNELPEPRVVPMEVLTQLTPLARTIRERSRMSGELILKRDLAGGRREELFVPRSQLAQQYQRLPQEYRIPFEEMGITSEDTQPAIQLPAHMRPPAKAAPPPPPGSSGPKTQSDEPTIQIKDDD